MYIHVVLLDNQSAGYEIAEQYLFDFSKEFYNHR